MLIAAFVGGVIGGVVGAAIAPITTPIVSTIIYLSRPALKEVGNATIKLGMALTNAFTTATQILWKS